MKYVLPQGRLFDSIYSYIDKYFEELDIDWSFYDDDDQNTDENIIEYFDSQYGNYEFQYIKKEYYQNLDSNDLGNKSLIDKWLDNAPILELRESLLPQKLNKIFDSDIWRPVFVKWFEDKYGLPVKTFI